MADLENAINGAEDFDWKEQERLDDLALNNLLANSQQPGAEGGALFDTERPLDIGEKADDALDYEDISDDDLPDEEPSGSKDDDAPGLTNDMDVDYDDDDDLFGEGPDAATFDDVVVEDHTTPNGSDVHHINGGLSMPSLEQEPEVDLRALNFPGLNDAAEKEDEYTEEDFKKAFPSFEPGGRLFWNELLPPKPAYFVPQAPAKQPKALNPTKISLDLAPDQEKQFRTAAPTVTDKRKRFAEAEGRGIVLIEEESSDEEEDEVNYDHVYIDPQEKIGNYNMMDLEIACMDWEAIIDKANQIAETPAVQEEEEELDEWEREVLGHSSKRKRVEEKEDFIIAPQYPLPNFDNFEELTAQIGKRVVLDMNDPYLLLDIQERSVASAAKRQRLSGGPYKRTGNGTFASTLQQRFNLSNDEAYDALKENHQIKVRAALGNVDVEHSMPALKLQWPYYRTKLYTREARSFHRPSLKFNKMLHQAIIFEKPGLRKKKAVKNLSTQEVFKETKDLSLADHYSTATLFEYSEEHPTVLSNFGMGNRIINYYRRKDNDDTERPQPEDKIGDVNVLQPNDKSPFSNFGMVDPGETVRTLHNAMYRAPIFKHDPKPTDFLVIRTSTGMGGIKWNIRNIDNLFVVGQQFPSTEIPGPHSRKVTNATKNRMRMIAYRQLRHNPHKQLKIGDITAHIVDSTDMQNRQKLKEFLTYDKVDKVWRMKPGEKVPEESAIRAMIKPEDVCVIDAMQVGARHLEDAGIVVEDKNDDDMEEDNGDSLEQHLAPWRTSKAFLEASSEKAMLRLHGPGDPSGCGLAFSFIKTSMKGGYLEGIQEGPHSSKAARAAMDAKTNGGHGYNVKTQQDFYNAAIREIWDNQKSNLTNPTVREHDDRDDEEPQVAATPATFDDNASVFSANDHGGRVMRITRKKTNKFGQIIEETEVVKDPRIWQQYQKRRRDVEISKTK
jgi:hypothetical protein